MRAGWAPMPAGASWLHAYAMALLCGIGFTMSLFIGGLAFQGQDAAYETQLKLGVLGGSLIAGLLGAAGGEGAVEPAGHRQGREPAARIGRCHRHRCCRKYCFGYFISF